MSHDWMGWMDGEGYVWINWSFAWSSGGKRFLTGYVLL